METKQNMQNNNSVLVILCGLPSSGKSWFARALADYLISHIQHHSIHILDIDKIRFELFGEEFLPENESFVRETAIMQAHEYLQSKSVTIIDDVNYYNSMRQDFKQIAEELNQQFIIFYISTPFEICLEWNKNRKNRIKESIILNIAEKFDVPGMKYLWDTPFDNIDLSKEDPVHKIVLLSDHIIDLLSSKNISLKSKVSEPKFFDKLDIDIFTRMFVNLYSKLVFYPHKKPSFISKSSKVQEKYETALFKIVDSPLFQQTLTKYASNIGTLNTKRRNYIENTQFDSIDSLHAITDTKLIQILMDFMKFLLL